MECMIYSTGSENMVEVQILPLEEYNAPFVSSQFCIVKRYEALFADAFPRFEKYENTPYALPAKNKAIRVYKGIDREPLAYTPDDFHEFTQQEAIAHYTSIPDRDIALLFIRGAGCDDAVPDGFQLLGYDTAWVFGHGASDGFSAICDCMFLCRWHGCDEEGTEFLPEYRKLNDNGLFNSAQDAAAYLMHYLGLDWTELGEYCIYEIYGQI